MKKTPRHVRLDPDVQEEVDKIAEVTGLAQVEVMRQMIAAGVRAIKENGYKLSLPLDLRVVDEQKKSSSPVSYLRRADRAELNEGEKKKAAS